ncbi:MAG: radical SAM protein [Actinobacteria bacterium]|nr:radical SAM protein [Actinomycetota bacterium]
MLRTYAGRYPMWCAWQVTYRCEMRCGFCNYWNDPAGKLPEQSVAEIAEGSRQLARLGSLFISMAGGEPMLREDLPEIVREVARWHLPFITTNGSNVTAQNAKELMQAGLWGVSVSIDYASAEKHDRRRGKRGCFDQAVRALSYFSKARVHRWQRVNVMTVLLHDNLQEVEELIKLARAHEAYLMIQPYGKLKTGSDRFHHREQDASEHLLMLKSRNHNFLSNPVFLSRFDQALDGGVPGCRAGQAFFNIDSTGDVSICVENRGRPVGNLYRDRIQNIIRDLRLASRANSCQSCWYNCRGETEMLYRPWALLKSLPTLFFDTGRPPTSKS